jgi:3-hydroxyisobutyrate dehydrogenase
MNALEQTIGWIGTGIMGRPMALNLIKKGFRLNVYNRTPEKAQEVIEAGGVPKVSPREVAETSDIIITIVTDTPDVQAMPHGIFRRVCRMRAWTCWTPLFRAVKSAPSTPP